jgi:DNA-binding NarL/FixJ family response regulator
MPLRVLIVDDNGPFLEAARDLLERQGLIVLGVASCAADAVSQAVDLDPDVALVDALLGNDSGFDVAKRLAEVTPRVQVVLISTYGEQDFADLLDDSPAAGFVSKSTLSARAIREVLDRADPQPGANDGR